MPKLKTIELIERYYLAAVYCLNGLSMVLALMFVAVLIPIPTFQSVAAILALIAFFVSMNLANVVWKDKAELKRRGIKTLDVKIYERFKRKLRLA